MERVEDQGDAEGELVGVPTRLPCRWPDDGAPVTFARWYTDWLEKAERTAATAPA